MDKLKEGIREKGLIKTGIKTPTGYVFEAYKEVELVKCLECGKLHEVSSEEFFRISGDLYVGLRGGLIGDGKKERENIICVDCFIDFIKEVKERNEEANHNVETTDSSVREVGEY